MSEEKGSGIRRVGRKDQKESLKRPASLFPIEDESSVDHYDEPPIGDFVEQLDEVPFEDIVEESDEPPIGDFIEQVDESQIEDIIEQPAGEPLSMQNREEFTVQSGEFPVVSLTDEVVEDAVEPESETAVDDFVVQREDISVEEFLKPLDDIAVDDFVGDLEGISVEGFEDISVETLFDEDEGDLEAAFQPEDDIDLDAFLEPESELDLEAAFQPEDDIDLDAFLEPESELDLEAAFQPEDDVDLDAFLEPESNVEAETFLENVEAVDVQSVFDSLDAPFETDIADEAEQYEDPMLDFHLRELEKQLAEDPYEETDDIMRILDLDDLEDEAEEEPSLEELAQLPDDDPLLDMHFNELEKQLSEETISEPEQPRPEEQPITKTPAKRKPPEPVKPVISRKIPSPDEFDLDSITLPDDDLEALDALMSLPAEVVRPLVITPKEERFPSWEDTGKKEKKPAKTPSKTLPKKPQRARKRRSKWYVNLFAILVALLGIGFVVVLASIWINPYSPLNPFPPFTPFVIITATPGEAATLPAASADTTPTVEPAQGLTMPFEMPTTSVLFATNENGQGCNWSSIAGVVVGLDNQPLDGYAVQILGENIDVKVFSGATQTFGAGGFEFQLGNAPQAADFTVQLFNALGTPLSDVYEVSTQNTCDTNVTIIRFEQIAPL